VTSHEWPAGTGRGPLRPTLDPNDEVRPRRVRAVRGTETQVTSPGAVPVTLAVTERGPRSASTHVLLLHGYPDDQTMWDDVVAALPDDWHVVTYDARGTGRSSRPADRGDYRAEHLVEDLVRVLDATLPEGENVHVVAHDWGSVIGWEAVAAGTWDPRLERVATYTSISGPPMDHLATLTSTWRGRWRMLPQLAHSIYAMTFLLPWIPELSVRHAQGLLRRIFGALDPTAHLLPWGHEVRHNAELAVNLYRANRSRLGSPVSWRTSTPVLLVVPLRDGFITGRALEHLDARCRDLTTVELDCGHWVPRARPQELADLVTAFVRSHPVTSSGVSTSGA
jgi:pimeloyl-ACP methyl ester carboxylesterase